jgi:hypothetical protein
LKSWLAFGRPIPMHRGVEVGISLRPGLPDENFVAQSLGNLAAFRLASERHERLEWQVLRVEGSRGRHHYRLVLRHPDRILDLGFSSQLESILHDLSNESVDELRKRLRTSESEGLHVVPLRHVEEELDLWQDDFWNWLG